MAITNEAQEVVWNLLRYGGGVDIHGITSTLKRLGVAAGEQELYEFLLDQVAKGVVSREWRDEAEDLEYQAIAR